MTRSGGGRSGRRRLVRSGGVDRCGRLEPGRRGSGRAERRAGRRSERGPGAQPGRRAPHARGRTAGGGDRRPHPAHARAERPLRSRGGAARPARSPRSLRGGHPEFGREQLRGRRAAPAPPLCARAGGRGRPASCRSSWSPCAAARQAAMRSQEIRTDPVPITVTSVVPDGRRLYRAEGHRAADVAAAARVAPLGLGRDRRCRRPARGGADLARSPAGRESPPGRSRPTSWRSPSSITSRRSCGAGARHRDLLRAAVGDPAALSGLALRVARADADHRGVPGGRCPVRSGRSRPTVRSSAICSPASIW